MNSFDWQTEIALDSNIQPQQPIPRCATAPRRVFLTGTTGFLGANLLSELLQCGTAEIDCLVRAESAAQGMQRLRSHLEALGLWHESWQPRIHPLCGDLTQPRLGLSPSEFSALAERIDVIHHCAAQIHFMMPYDKLRAANVLGTQEVLRLAALHAPKPVHFSSSLSVFFGRAHLQSFGVSENDSPILDDTSSGYTQSKWAAELLVRAAQARGLPATIYRTGRITGHSQTGATSSPDDLLNSFVKACILLDAYPAVQFDVAMTPVDYISRAVLHLAQDQRSFGRAFHLFQPQPIPFSELIRILHGLGYALRELPYEQWLLQLKQTASSAHPQRAALARLWMLLTTRNSLFAGRPRYETPNSRELFASSSIACPPVDEALISSYVGFFVRSGYLPPPA